MEPITIRGKIEFCADECKEYSREFTATLADSGASPYGNRTSVFIEFGLMRNGRRAENVLLDTRYDMELKRNEASFRLWLKNYFLGNYSKNVLTIY